VAYQEVIAQGEDRPYDDLREEIYIIIGTNEREQAEEAKGGRP
jgi:hypothetical protein